MTKKTIPHLAKQHFNRRALLSAAGASLVTAAATAQEQIAQPVQTLALEPEVRRQVLNKISSYLNGLKSLKGRFVQIAPYGNLDEGNFYLRRPGRLRFDYDEPNPLVIVSDGTWVMVKDDRVQTVDRYPLSMTPLKFLLRKNIDLAKDGHVSSVTRLPPDGVLVTAREEAGEAQGEITLYFGEYPISLREWVITDAQGLQTRIVLDEVVRDTQIDADLFIVKEALNPFDKRGGRR